MSIELQSFIFLLLRLVIAMTLSGKWSSLASWLALLTVHWCNAMQMCTVRWDHERSSIYNVTLLSLSLTPVRLVHSGYTAVSECPQSGHFTMLQAQLSKLCSLRLTPTLWLANRAIGGAKYHTHTQWTTVSERSFITQVCLLYVQGQDLESKFMQLGWPRNRSQDGFTWWVSDIGGVVNMPPFSAHSAWCWCPMSTLSFDWSINYELTNQMYY